MFGRWIKHRFMGNDDRSFSPAMIRLQQRPPAVGAQIMLVVICVIFGSVALWASLGHINILVTGYGKIETVSHLTRIQPVAVGKISRLLVEEGDHVSDGQLLLELDTTEFDVDKLHIERKIAYQALILDRLAMTSDVISLGRREYGPLLSATPLDPEFVEFQQLKMKSEINSYFAELEKFDGRVQEKIAEKAEVTASLNKLERFLAISTEQENAKRVLSEQKVLSRLSWLEERRNLIADEQELYVLKQRERRIEASIRQVKQEKLSYKAAVKSQIATDRLVTLEELSMAREELKRVATRIAHSQLRSPLSGVVHRLQAYRAGEVLVEAQPVMQIIPDDTAFEVSAYVPNRDIGFVRSGSEAVIKVESYPYTQYGQLTGTVKAISPDAIELAGGGLYFEVKITLDQQYIDYHGRKLSLTPGMSVLSEIKTGDRKLMEYFLSPLIKIKDNAFSER
ncbi:hypothetical protein RJ45_08805 [Photobacterium gaetbulicola]|uniref:Membrane fusion protein (MFP) family protein n=1 Tax=Photobacterium gaetbulicola TaxID=1295392 RepID=A0A0B9GGT1_9GAMM|nr:HlyD family type I secretion periplasmic adaptor subunit [Photobacterium gaetbulicola]KHT64000.1 hypothetical protein RJ45_08805 [Photobacterium gaetbulicola]